MLNDNRERIVHIKRLDVLRGVAILIVFIFHFAINLYGTDYYQWNGNFRSFEIADHPLGFLLYPLTLGWSGVSLFFVVSGFVIHISYLNSKNFNFKNFYWRRFWRIYPAYFIALLFFLSFGYIKFLSKDGFIHFLTHIFFIYNFNDKFFDSVNSSFWSLALEVQFYLLYPVVLFLRKRFEIEKALVFTLALSIIIRVSLLFFIECPYPISVDWTITPILWFDWVLGAFIAEKFYKGERAFNFSNTMTIGLLILFILSTLYKPSNAFSFSFASLVSGIIIDKYVNNKSGLSKLEHLFLPVGLSSYSVYLWHQPLIHTIFKLVKKTFKTESPYIFPVQIITTSVIVFCFCYVMYLLVENRSLVFAKTASKLLFKEKF